VAPGIDSDRPPRAVPPGAWHWSLLFLCLALGTASRVWVAPQVAALDPELRSVTLSNIVAELREQPDASPRTRQLVARRTDQALLTTGPIAIVQGAHDWVTAGGRETVIESSGLYGVDRSTRSNVRDYGDRERSGQYLFPAPAPRANLTLWDPTFRIGWQARFEQADRMAGIETHRYALEVASHDDSDAFRSLAGVPDRWRVTTEATGTLWVEPVTGTVLERVVRGSSWFVTADGGARVAEAATWRAQFSPETRQQQLALAIRERRLQQLFGLWLPMVAFGAATGFATLLVLRRR
jgi:hypothetical protein